MKVYNEISEQLQEINRDIKRANIRTSMHFEPKENTDDLIKRIKTVLQGRDKILKELTSFFIEDPKKLDRLIIAWRNTIDDEFKELSWNFNSTEKHLLPEAVDVTWSEENPPSILSKFWYRYLMLSQKISSKEHKSTLQESAIYFGYALRLIEDDIEKKMNELKHPKDEFSHREVIFAHNYKVLAKESEPKTGPAWRKERGGRAEHEFATTQKGNKIKYKAPTEKELRNIIELLKDSPSALKLMLAENQ